MEINNQQFIEKTELIFRSLFADAKKVNELHFAMALSPGFLPYKYNPALEATIAFQQYVNFFKNKDYLELRPRIALAFYCHLAEARGYWEIIKNMLCIANGERYNPYPFSEFIKKHRETGKKIAPNANKIFQSLIGCADSVGKNLLAEILKDAYDPDLRNSYAHADYVLIDEGVVVNSRDGYERIILWEKFEAIINRGINFYSSLLKIVDENLHLYSEEKILFGCIANEPAAKWSIYYDPKTGIFSLNTVLD